LLISPLQKEVDEIRIETRGIREVLDKCIICKDRIHKCALKVEL
jgi:hypothetical protein